MEYFVIDKIMNNCEHYFECGYTLVPIVYCTKCNKELDDCGYDISILQTHEIINGKLTLIHKKHEKQNLFS